jgi:hypothetical protein
MRVNFAFLQALVQPLIERYYCAGRQTPDNARVTRDLGTACPAPRPGGRAYDERIRPMEQSLLDDGPQDVTTEDVLGTALDQLPADFPLPDEIHIRAVNPRSWVVSCERANDDQPYFYSISI